MAKINIQNINYIVTGKEQKILNLDVYTDSSTKISSMTFFTDTENGIDLSATFKANDSSTARFPNPNQFGYLILNSNNVDGTNNKYTLRALYDAKDVAFKSAVAKNISRNVPDEDNSIDNDIDIYFPHLLKDPLGFVQIQQYGYGMSEETRVAPVMLGTDLKDQRNVTVKSKTSYAAKPTWRYNLNPYDRFNSNEEDPGTIENTIPTYTYTSLKNLQKIVDETLEKVYQPKLSDKKLSDDALNEWNAAKEEYNSISYYSFRKFAEIYLNDNNALTNFFKPVYNFKNIEHNYLFEVPVADGSGQFNNVYNKAQIKADIIMAKNVYDDIYDTNISAVGKFDRIRQYVGISNCGGKVFLKYFDDRTYETEKDFKDDENYIENNGHVENVSMKNTNNEDENRHDYMKIEYLKSINRFISSAMHKTNLFSTKVYGLDNLLENKHYSLDVQNKIKQDIDNSIRRIVKNFTPAHTQYFGVVDWSRDNYDEASKRMKC